MTASTRFGDPEGGEKTSGGHEAGRDGGQHAGHDGGRNTGAAARKIVATRVNLGGGALGDSAAAESAAGRRLGFFFRLRSWPGNGLGNGRGGALNKGLVKYLGTSLGNRAMLRDNPLPLLALALVFLLVLIVIFVLPRLVDAPRPVVAADTPAAVPRGAPAAPPQAGAVLPWQKARHTELRKEAQTILGEMLEAEKALQEKGVASWAAADYERAMTHAQSGDQHYNRRDYPAAVKEYRRANDIFAVLLERIDPLFEETIAAGLAAVESGEAEKANIAFDLALTIDALDRRAQAGKARAINVGSVFDLLGKGDRARENGELAEAKSLYQEALALDPVSTTVAARLENIEHLLRQREFSAAMSEGFRNLQNDKLRQAQKAFARALRLFPDSKDAAAALGQTRHSLTAQSINRLLTEAGDLETAEEWGAAMEKYQAALKLNADLGAARQGLERSRGRADAHARLDHILGKPKRLYDSKTLKEATAFLAAIKKVAAPGPKLARKIAELEMAATRAATPVRVPLRSDNKTRVLLYKVGELGLFSEKELLLRPGDYVAVGRRDGYRDARVEFFVAPDAIMAPVSIVSEEEIALGN